MSFFILYDAEDAWKTYLKAQTFTTIPPANVYSGIFNSNAAASQTGLETTALPAIRCVCESADPHTEQATAWLVEGYIEVRANADDTTGIEFRNMVREVMAVIHSTTIRADLSAAIAAFSVMSVNQGPQEYAIEERSWVARQNFQMHCTGKSPI